MTDHLTAEDAARLPLFQAGSFTLASGADANWKIECDALTDDDWSCLALMLAERLPAFGDVEGVPSGGLPLAAALKPYATNGSLLIVDDVWTTGGSMRRHRAGRESMGAVVFARNPVEPWVLPLFTMPLVGVVPLPRFRTSSLGRPCDLSEAAAYTVAHNTAHWDRVMAEEAP